MVLRAQPGAAGVGAARPRRTARVVGTVAISFHADVAGGEERRSAWPSHLATDPGYRGRGIFARARSARTRSAGASGGRRLLLVVPNAASAPILLGRLGWTRAAAAARPRAAAPAGPAGAASTAEPRRAARAGDRVLRDAPGSTGASPTRRARYAVLERDGYAVVGAARAGRRRRGGRAATCSRDARARPPRDRVRDRRCRRRGSAGGTCARASCRRRSTFTAARQVARRRAAAGAAALRARRPRLPVSRARLRHAAGRPGASRARRRRCRRSARSRAASTRSSCSPTARSPARCRRTAASALFGAGSQARRAARASRPRSTRELAPRPLAVVAHMTPALRGARGAARAPAAACRCCSGSRTGSVRGRCMLAERALDGRAHGRPPLVPARLAEGRPDRPRYRPRALPLRRAASPRERLRVLALGRTSPAKGYETIVRGGGARRRRPRAARPVAHRRGARRARAARGARGARRGAAAATPRSRRCLSARTCS